MEDDYQFKINGLEHKITDEELRLLYVACTRAKVSLNIHHIYDLVQQLKLQAPQVSQIRRSKTSRSNSGGHMKLESILFKHTGLFRIYRFNFFIHTNPSPSF
jgi:ATP-dependent exoDNAse (exonuclease V) beta subunit